MTLDRRARLGASAAHRPEDVEQSHVVGHDGDDVDDVLEVAPEAELRRTRDEPHDHFDREPGRAQRLSEEEPSAIQLDPMRQRMTKTG